MSTISACIVTYNRKKELFRCLDSVLNQSCQLNHIVIFDNCSTDGTLDALIDKFNSPITIENKLQKLVQINTTTVWLITSPKNTGGAGGFHEAVKLSREYFNTDYYWLMDDDGYPHIDCLKKILTHSEQHHHDYVMPVSIDIKNHQHLSWSTRNKNGKKTELYKELCDSWGNFMDYITPFNGSLLSRECIDKVGYINKKFFIWGDEYEHYWRCKEAGIHPITLTKAIFYHPALKLPLEPTFFGLLKVPFSNSKLRMVCLVRNYTYIYKKYDNQIKIPAKLLIYTWFFLVTRRFDIEGLILYLKCVYDGLRGNFTRHLKYLR